MSFCSQMAAAIDGARTLTRLDHLSRSIWQGLAAGAVGDDDAQALAERLHVRRSVLRGEIKPVGIPLGRPSIFPPRRLQREDRKSTRLNSSHANISYAVFCLKKKTLKYLIFPFLLLQ